MDILSKKESEKYHEQVLKGKSVSNLQKENGYPVGYLNRCFRKYNLEYSVCRRDYDIDNYFFDTIKSEIKAYTLGLIWADGNIAKTKTGQARFNIRLKQSDGYILERIKSNLAPGSRLIDIKVKQYTKKDGTIPLQKEFALSSDYIVNRLKSYGILPAKTWDVNRNLPYVLPKYRPHLLRGIFDGNGHTRLRNKGTTKMTCSEVGLSSTSLISLEEFRDILLEFDPSIRTRISNITKSKQYTSLYQLTITGYHSIVALGYYLYRDATIYLKRKQMRFKLASSRVIHPIGNTNKVNANTILYANTVLTVGLTSNSSVESSS